MSKFSAALDNYFHITEKGSNIKTEIIAGLTTFMTMAYILIVNPNLLGEVAPASGVYIATAIGAIVGTLIMALYAKLPFAQAPGMGLNAYFAFTVAGTAIGGSTFGYAGALVIILISGLIFLLLTLIGVREKIVDCVPDSVKLAIPAGIGLFIAFVGLQNAGIIIPSESTGVTLAPLNILKINFSTLWPYFATFITFAIIAIMSKLKIKGSILWGMLAGTGIFYIVALIACGIHVAAGNAWADAATWYGLPNLKDVWTSYNPVACFKSWGTDSVGVLFYKSGDMFKNFNFSSFMLIVSVILAFGMVDMFDTIGTLIGTAQKADMLDENGKLPEMKKALFADATATVVGAVCGTSTVTTFVESSAGVAEGGRTGLTSLIVAICFFVAMFLSPIAFLIPTCATAAALVYVGVLMIGGVTKIDFSDITVAVPAFLTIAMMPLTYNISYGIALGMITHCILTPFTKDPAKRKPNIITIIIAILFVCNFIFVSH